jgi:predicted CXXCH cytochrome family protein
MSEHQLDRWRILLLAALTVAVLAVPIYLLKQRQAPAAPPAGFAPAFVGRQECRQCHEVEYEAWLGSDHDLAMDVADSSTVLGDFGGAVFTGKGGTTRFFRRGGRYLVSTPGPDGLPAEFQVTHVFGHEPLQQYLIPMPGGRLQCLTVAWDTERGRWFDLYPDQEIPPGDWLHWTGGGQNWNGMCAECHSTNLRKNFDAAADSFHTIWSEIDVSCEACHGPGSEHVRWARIQPMARPESPDLGLVIPTRDLTGPQLVNLCAPCHARRSELGDYTHTRVPLLDQMLPSTLDEDLYHADGQIQAEVYVYGSFVQSKMFANDVSCRDCHDSHSGKLRLEGNALCLQCHRADAYDTYDHHFHQKVHEGRPSPGALCVKCHMPEQPYMVIDWRADHSLRVPRPDLSRDLGTPSACNTADCHGDKSVEWSVQYYEQWYGKARKPHYGTTLAAGRRGSPGAGEQLIILAGDHLYPAMVRATALSLLGGYPSPEATRAFAAGLVDDDPLVRRTAVLGTTAADPGQYIELLAPLLFDPVRGVRLAAASRLAAAPAELLKPYQQQALKEALDEYVAAMEYGLDLPHAGHNLGNLYAAIGDAARAESAYRQALRVDDRAYGTKTNLAVLLSGQGRNQEAETLLREVLEDFPDQHEVAYSLGLLLAEMGRYREAVVFLRRAAEGMPGHPRAARNLREVEDFLERTSQPR